MRRSLSTVLAVAAAALAALLAAGAACTDHVVLRCSFDASCGTIENHGRCYASPASAERYCAYPDGSCASGWRWEDTAGEHLAGTCYVPPPGDGGATDGG